MHRTPFGPPPDAHVLPIQLTSRQLSVRAFDADTFMIDAVVAGHDLADTLDRFLSEEACDHVHVHNAGRGCWAVRVDRAADPSRFDRHRPITDPKF